ncbi:hypothetical protein L9F63_021819, partial [Diploptera punctata]
GLERVAEELMGRRKWKLYQDTVLKSSARVEPEIQDWEPMEKCSMCDGPPFPESATSPAASDSGSTGTTSSLRETPPESAVPTTMTTLQSVTSMAASLAAVAALSAGTGTGSSPAMPFYPPPTHFSQWYLSQPPPKQDPIPGTEQPLDLSAKAVPSDIPVPVPPDPSLKVPSVDNKHIFKAKPRMSTVAGRRTYTEEELQAALRDIQSGKLGTRRAAVIYGIPRSTLRNKVYKLALERERDSHLVAPVVTKPEEPAHEEEEEKELSGAEEEREVEKALRKPLLSMEDLVRLRVLKDPSYSEVWAGMEHSALGPYVSQLLAAHNKTPSGDQSTPGDKSPTGGDFLPKFPTPLLPEFVRRMMAEEEQLKKQKTSFHPNGAHADDKESESPDASTGIATPPSNVILKIPSFKPTSKNGVATSSGGPEPSSQPPSDPGKGIGVSLREVIAKSISQKFQQHDVNEPPFKRGRFTPPLGSSTSVIKHNNNNNSSSSSQSDKVVPHVQSKPMSSSSSSSGAGGKGTRPKRGKYRNYDRDSLIEAVRAVQRGEMSVHRAGSHFGVPHSTLEYKVKERHLMRPRKREPKPPLEDVKKKDETRHPAVGLEKPKIPPKTIPKAPFTPSSSGIPSAPNGLKLPTMFDPANMPPMPYATAPPFPFWTPSPFHSLPLPGAAYNPSQDFFASQMMQRLQEHAGGSTSPPLGKNAREMAESLYDGTGANGSFLDGIIRSSLEMGVSPGLTKEVPENNKALIDQLCRNSRLTPLPRSVMDAGASSSDDDSAKRVYGYGRATESEASMSAIIDLSPSSNGSVMDRKRPADDEDDVKPDTDIETEESACDSKNISNRVDEQTAKDEHQKEEEEEEDEEEEEEEKKRKKRKKKKKKRKPNQRSTLKETDYNNNNNVTQFY